MRTLKELYEETLQIIASYSNKGSVIVNDKNNKDYLFAMPYAANFAMRELAQIRPIIKKIQITQYPPDVCDTNMFAMIRHTSNDIVREYLGARAYYFEVDNPCVVTIEHLDGTPITEGMPKLIIENKSVNQFAVYNGLVNKGVRIVFSSLYEFTIRNLNCYKSSFASVDDITPYTSYIRHDLRVLTTVEGKSDFWQVDRIIFQGNTQNAYVKDYAFDTENKSVLVLNYFDKGSFDVFYKAYPKEIKADSDENMVVADNMDSSLLDDDMVDAVPLYIASRVFLDDEPSTAQYFFEQYEGKKQFIRDISYNTAKDMVIEGGI